MAAKPDTINWHSRASNLVIRGQAFIDGRYVDAASGATFDSINPATGKLLAKIASCDQADVDRAVANARKVFDQGSWSHLAPRQRKQTLLQVRGPHPQER